MNAELGTGYVISKVASDNSDYDKFYVKLDNSIDRDLLANIIGVQFDYYDERHVVHRAFSYTTKQCSNFDIYTKRINN